MRCCTAICVALALGGCDLVFPVGGVKSDDCDGETHDEDGDGIPDPCDLCPGIKDDQADFDLDGVGDVCDLHPDGDDTPVEFLTFEEGFPFEAEWIASGGGQWRIIDPPGVMAQTQPGVDGYAGRMPRAWAETRTIEAGVVLLSPDIGPPRSVAVFIDVPPGLQGGYACGVAVDGTAAYLELWALSPAANLLLESQTLDYYVDATHPVSLAIAQDANGLVCRIHDPSGDVEIPYPIPELSLDPYEIGLGAGQTAAEFQYVAIYE